MEVYKENYLEVYSDFPIRKLNEFEEDEDLIIGLENQVVNIFFDQNPGYVVDRFQITEVKSILIRHSLKEDYSLASIHFLRVIDLNSSLLNFTIDLDKVYIKLEDRNTSINFYLKNRI